MGKKKAYKLPEHEHQHNRVDIFRTIQLPRNLAQSDPPPPFIYNIDMNETTTTAAAANNINNNNKNNKNKGNAGQFSDLNSAEYFEANNLTRMKNSHDDHNYTMENVDEEEEEENYEDNVNINENDRNRIRFKRIKTKIHDSLDYMHNKGYSNEAFVSSNNDLSTISNNNNIK